MKRKIMNCIFGVIFIAGLSLLLYPFVADKWNTHRQNQLMTTYEEILDEQVALGSISYEAEMDKADEYNTDLLPKVLPDAFAIYDAMDVPDEQYMSCLNVTGDGMMGSVEIPKIDVKLPVLHGTTEGVLQKAVGHLEGTSLPTGGAGNHCVLSAHCGLPSARLFTDLDRMKTGDQFTLTVLNREMIYEIDQILTVEPQEVEALYPVEGEDYCTLVTCTPYGVNSHRLLVRGRRIRLQ